MKKLLAILFATLALQGCIWQTINANDIETANKICASMDSTVTEVTAEFSGKEWVMCSNRQYRRF